MGEMGGGVAGGMVVGFGEFIGVAIELRRGFWEGGEC